MHWRQFCLNGTLRRFLPQMLELSKGFAANRKALFLPDVTQSCTNLQV